MRRASLPARLERLGERRATVDLERTVAEPAEDTELHPTEIRAELEVIEARTRRFGPETPEQMVRRCAEAYGLSEDALWAEVRRITGPAGAER